MKTTNQIICPDCGAQMSHHADKIDGSTSVAEKIDATPGVALEDVHVYSECGKAVTRNSITTNQARPTRLIRRQSFAYHGIL